MIWSVQDASQDYRPVPPSFGERHDKRAASASDMRWVRRDPFNSGSYDNSAQLVDPWSTRSQR